MPLKSLVVLLLTLAAAYSAAPGFAAGDKARARRYFDEGIELYRRGDFADALSSLTKSITEDNSFLPAYAVRAQVRHALGDDPGKESDLKQGLRISSLRHPEDAVARGNARLLAGDIKLAMKDFESALKMDPSNADAFLGRGRAYRGTGDLVMAYKDWTAALKLDPNLILARYNRARALYEMGKKDKVIEDLTRTLQDNPRFYLPYGLLGVMFAEKGDSDRALKAYSKAIMLNTDYAFGYLGRAAVRLKLGDSKLAFNDFDEAVRAAPDDYAPYYNRAEARYRKGDREAALPDYRKILETRLDWPSAGLAVGDRLMEYGRFEEALRMYSKSLSAAASSQESGAGRWIEKSLLKRAAAYQSLREDSKAMKDLNEALRLSSSSVEGLTARGQLTLRTGGDIRKAEDDLHRALRLDPKFAAALVARGSLRARLGKQEEALKDFTAAIESAPEYADAYNNRGALFANALKDFDRAVEDISKAVELDDRNAGYLLNLSAARIQRRDYWKAADSAGKALKLKANPEQCLLLLAQTHFLLGNRVKAIQDIEEALAKNPRSSALHSMLGSFRLRSREFSKAVPDLSQALSLDPKNTRALVYRGLSYGGLGEYKKALKDFEKAADNDPKSADARAYACQTFRLLGRSKEAVRYCNFAVEIDPQHSNALLNRGLAYLALKEYAQAARDLDESNRSGVPSAAAFLARSVAHAGVKQYKESDSAYRAGMLIDYQARLADSNFGEPTDTKNEYPNLIEPFDTVMTQDTEIAESHLVLGNALSNASHFDRAIQEYTRAVEIDGNLPAAYLDRGLALVEQQSYDSAEHDLRRAIDLGAKGPQAHIALLTMLTARKRNSEGLKAAAEAIRLYPKSAEVYIKAGNLRYFLNDSTRAEENYELALKNDGASAAAHNGIGLCRFVRKEYDSAIESFSRAIALRPDSDRFYRNRASAFVNLGDYANAAKDYKIALDVNQDPEMVEEYRKLILNAQSRIAKQAASEEKPKDKKGK
jgi:tetratricopeptide (TPR) repeat protein